MQLESVQFTDDFIVVPLTAKAAGLSSEHHTKLEQVIQKKIQRGKLKKHAYSTDRIAVYRPSSDL